MTTGAARQVEHGVDLSAGEIRGDELDRPLGLGLVPMLIDVKVVLAEPFLEPVRLL